MLLHRVFVEREAVAWTFGFEKVQDYQPNVEIGQVTTQATERFRILNEFIGFGTLPAPIWFIGLEEAGAWNVDPEKDREAYGKYARRSFPTEKGEIEKQAREARKKRCRYTSVYDIMSKLVVAVLGGTCNMDWKSYRDTRLFVEGGETFQANLYPLGKKSLKTWPAEYETLFDLSSREDYYSSVRETRFAVLRSAHERYRPRLTICFGKIAWPDFIEVLKLDSQTCDDTLKGYRIYPNGVVLTPFFSYRSIRSDSIKVLADRLRNFLHASQSSI